MRNQDEEYEVVAAIMAALKYYEGSEDFEIKSIKRVDDDRKWHKAGRNEIIQGKQQIYLRRRRPL